MMSKRTMVVPDGKWRCLADLLDQETASYRRLLRLARRQNSYMKRQDVDRLEANAAEWARHLPTADAVRISRERLLTEMRTELGLTGEDFKVRDLLNHAGAAMAGELGRSLAGLRDATADLARQNDLNGNLAAFCLDMAREEARIFRDSILEDPAACYDQDARTSNRGAGGLLVRQA